MREIMRVMCGAIVVMIFSFSISIFASEEKLTLTTYYPSPYGDYKELKAYRMKIGATYTSAAMTDSDNGELWVEGPVGIGTTSPGEKLHIQGPADVVLRIDSKSSGNDPKVILTDANNPSGEGLTITYDSSVGDTYFNNVYTSSTGAFHFQRGAFTAGGTDLVTLLTNGNVGIGTANPGAKLSVYTATNNAVDGVTIQGSDGHWIRQAPSLGQGYFNSIVQSGDTGIIFSNGTQGTGGFVIAPWAAAISGLRMDGSGNVGIGTIGPVQKLHVAGNIYSSGGVDHDFQTASTLQNNTSLFGGIYQNSGDGLLNAAGTAVALPDWWHVINMHHQHYNGFSAQIAVPLAPWSWGGANNYDIYFRTSIGTTWSEWRKVLSENTSGCVGIGTTSPVAKLEVAGDFIRTIAYAQGSGADGTCDVNAGCGPAALSARKLVFTKKKAATKVRVQYTDTMRSYSGDTSGARACQWEIRFNGAYTGIKNVVYSHPGDDEHHGRTLFGYVSGLSAGTYTIQVYVSNVPGYEARCYTGWPGNTNWTIEAEEVN